MTTGKSPLDGVNIERSDDSPSPGRFRRPTGEWLSTDELLDLLSSGRRRCLVAHLHSSDGPVPLSEAVAHVSESERGGNREAAVATDLHHVHLPKLVGADVVRHDREADVLEAGPNADRAVRLLDAVTDEYSSDGRRPTPLAETCSIDVVFRLLADRIRRFLLSTLRECDGRVRLDELAERVAAWKENKPVAAVTSDELRAAEIELHHKHLPMLTGAGVLEYDRETKTLPERERPVSVAEWLVGCPSLETFETPNGA